MGQLRLSDVSLVAPTETRGRESMCLERRWTIWDICMDSAREAVKERGKGAVCVSLIAFSGSTLRQGARGETSGLGGPRWSKAREEMGEVSLGRRSAQWEASFPPSQPPVGGAHHSQNPYFTDQGLKGQKVEVKELNPAWEQTHTGSRGSEPRFNPDPWDSHSLGQHSTKEGSTKRGLEWLSRNGY